MLKQTRKQVEYNGRTNADAWRCRKRSVCGRDADRSSFTFYMNITCYLDEALNEFEVQ